MRILYLTGHYPPDLTSGATLQVQRLAAAAQRAGHDVRVVAGNFRSGLTPGSTRDDVIDGVEVHWIGTAGWTDQDRDENWWNPVAATAVARCLDSWKPDVVHAHALQTLGADSLLAAADRGVRTVVTMHDFWWVCARLFLVDRDMRPCSLVPRLGNCECSRSVGWRLDRERRLRQVLDRVDVVLTPSQSVRDVLAANGIRALVDPNDVDLQEMADSERVFGSDPSPLDDVRFLYVGGANPLKGAHVVRAAAASLRAVPGWRMVAHGVDDPSDPPFVVAPPFEPDRRGDVLRSADVLVLPSIARESFSLIAREALLTGLAVITSDCLGPEEVVESGVNGLVVPAGDPDALAAAMRCLIDDRELLARLKAGARATELAGFDADQHFAALLPHYTTTPTSDRMTPTAIVVSAAAHDIDTARALADLESGGWDAEVIDESDPSIADAVAARDLAVLVGDVDAVASVVVRARPVPRVRIVVVNYRGRDLTLRCLEHLDALTYPPDRREVVIVDNDSGDGLVEHLRATRPDVTVIESPVNGGFGAGCNLGMRHPGAWDAVALVNNDSVPEPGWLDALVDTWRHPPVTEHPVGAVAGKVLLAGSLLVNSAGCRLLDGAYNADRGDGLPDDGTYDEACEVFGWSGAGVLLTRELIDDIGEFEEPFFLYYEDVDMVWRGRRRGWSVAYAPTAVSVHDRGASSGRGDLFDFHEGRNRLFVLARHAPWRWLARALAIQARCVLRGDSQPRRAMRLRILVSFARHAPRLARQRRALARRSTVAVDEVTAWLDR